MIVETIQLSSSQDTIVQLSKTTQVALDGRELRRYLAAGYKIVRNEDRIEIRLTGNGAFRDRELIFNLPTTIVIDGNKTHEYVSSLKLVGTAMEVDVDENQRQAAYTQQRAAEMETLRQQEQQLRASLEQKSAEVADLRQHLEAERQQATELSDTITQLQTQNAALVAANGSLDQLRNNLSQVNSDLAEAQAITELLNHQLDQATSDRDNAVRENEITASAISFLQQQITDEQNNHARLQAQVDALTNELNTYGPESTQALSDTIQALRDQLTEATKRYTKLLGEQRVLNKQVAKQSEDNNRLEQEIAQQPEELRRLQESHEDLSRRLTETIRAQEMCSEEKQKELQNQIAEQTPIAEQLTEQYNTLQTQAQALTETISNLQQSQRNELVRLYPLLAQGLSDIKQNVGNMGEEMDSLQKDVEQFNQNVQTCASRLERLKEWYNVDKTPLQKLQERLGNLTNTENEQLRQTMNPTCVSRIQTLFTDVENGLAQLDEILGEVITAARRDENFINLKISTNEQYARQEIIRQ